MIFNLVFFIVATSVLLQGTSLRPLAQWLGLQSPLPSTEKSMVRLESPDSIGTGLTEITISSTSAVAGKQSVELGLPDEVVVMMMSGNGHAFLPMGRSTLQAHDKLMILLGQSN